MMTEERLTEIRARADAATEGPWVCDVRVGCVAVYDGPKRSCLATGESFIYYKPGKKDPEGDWATEAQHEADAAFIAHARQDVPYLLDLLARVAALVATTKEVPEATPC